MVSQGNRVAAPAVMVHHVLLTSTRDHSLVLMVQQPCHRRMRHPYPQDTHNCSPLLWANATATCHSRPSSTYHDGDLYEHLSEFPPPYAQHAIAVSQCQPAALTDPGRTSVAHIVVATVIVYVTWVAMQVIQRTLERYLA